MHSFLTGDHGTIYILRCHDTYSHLLKTIEDITKIEDITFDRVGGQR